MPDYDVIVVGAGFAGSALALALAEQGKQVGLLTQSLDSVALPFSAIRGAYSAWEYHMGVKYTLEQNPNIHALQLSVSELLVTNNRVEGVSSWEGLSKTAPVVVLALGSFISPELSIGQETEPSGRLSEAAYPDLPQQLQALGFKFERHSRSCTEHNYSVAFDCFAASNFKEPYTLALEGLYAVGLCTNPHLNYQECEQQALELAHMLKG